MKIIRISKCEDCPHFDYAYETDNCLYVCEHIDVGRRRIKDKAIIQDFCPLKEAKI